MLREMNEKLVSVSVFTYTININSRVGNSNIDCKDSLKI